MKEFIRVVVVSLLIFTSRYASANLDSQIILVCPSIYEVLAPEEYQYFQQSYLVLEARITLEAGSLPLDYYVEQNFGLEDVQSVRGLVDFFTRQTRSELASGAVTKNELEQIMSMCPAYWF